MVFVSGWKSTKRAAEQLREKLDHHMGLCPCRALIPDEEWNAMITHAANNIAVGLSTLGDPAREEDHTDQADRIVGSYIHGTVVGSKYLGEVDADRPEEAIQKAWSLAHVSLCHQCASECEDPEIAKIVAQPEDGGEPVEDGE